MTVPDPSDDLLGVFEFGVLTLPHGPTEVNVDFDRDGNVGVEWVEGGGGYYGSTIHAIQFSRAEFDRIVACRKEARNAR